MPRRLARAGGATPRRSTLAKRMGAIPINIAAHVGNTPMVRLTRLVPEGLDVELYGKLEAFNPGGSVKDRIGVAMIEAAEAEGRIEPGRTTIVEATSGNTGIALAFCCAAKGYDLTIFLPQGMSREREALLRLYGARVEVVESLGGMNEAVDAARADARDKRIHVSVQRVPDLGAGRAAVDLGVRGVRKLIRQEHVVVCRHRSRSRDRLVHAAKRLGHFDARPIETQQPLALAAHPLRQRQHQLIALRGAHKRERDAGVAARRLDDRRTARLDAALALGRLDHRDADAVLDAAAGVERLELRKQPGVAARREQPRELDHRRAADMLGNVDRDLRHCRRGL